MINLEEVTKVLEELGGFSAEELDNYSTVINNSVGAIEASLTDEAYSADDRIVFLAAARAYYTISLLGGASGELSSFSAGDVRLGFNTNGVSSVKELLALALEAAEGMVNGNGFAFRGV
ncbi:MAG: hypothetical protein IJS03_02455 [Eubacterium sp.]|nr:hypothetical protein [Eubacterium sp.]